MATSGSLTSTVKFGNFKLTLTQTSQDIANNCSYWTATLTYTLQAYGRINASATQDIAVTVNGTKYTGTYKFGNVDNSNNQNPITKTIFTKTGIKVPHTSDGSKTFSIAFSAGVNITYGGTYIGTASKSGSITANAIPRASSFGTISGNTIGSDITININRHSTSFTHTLCYAIGDGNWHEFATGVGDKKVYTLPMSLCSDLPNATSGTLKLKLTTYNGSTIIGSDVTTSLTVYVPSSVVPSVSSINVSEATANLASAFGVYLKSKSTLKTTITASGSYGSTIKTYKTTIDGTNYNGSSFTTYALKTSGTLTITTTVTDSRGRTASKSTTITVYDYFAPRITQFTVARCLSDGTLDDEGTYVKCTYSYEIAPINNKNTKTVKILRSTNGSSYSVLTTETASSYSESNKVYKSTVVFDANTSYLLYLSVTDYFGEVTSGDKELPTVFVLINHHASGTGIGFGKVCENPNSAEFGLPIRGVSIEAPSKCLGVRPIESPSADTVDNWDRLFNGLYYYNLAGYLTDQPTTYGLLQTLTNGNKNVHQMWYEQPSGSVHHRGGNSNGWSGTWRTFLDSINFSNYALSLAGGTLNGNLNIPFLNIYYSPDTSKTNKGRIYVDENGRLYLESIAGDMGFIGGGHTLFLLSDRFRTGGNDVLYLGDASNRWKAVYAVNGTIQSSDRNLKENIEEIDKKYEALFNNLKPVTFEFKGNDHDRVHVGFIAQEVKEAMTEVGLTDIDFAGYCEDLKREYDKELKKDIEVLDEDGKPIKTYSLRYNEFIALNTHMIQKQQKEIKDLKDEVAQLKDLVNQLVKGAQ